MGCGNDEPPHLNNLGDYGSLLLLWLNAKGNPISDEQALVYLASYGILCAALEAGEIELVAGKMKAVALRDPTIRRKGRGHAKLAEYL